MWTRSPRITSKGLWIKELMVELRIRWLNKGVEHCYLTWMPIVKAAKEKTKYLSKLETNKFLKEDSVFLCLQCVPAHSVASYVNLSAGIELCFWSVFFLSVKLIRKGEIDAALGKLSEWYPQIVQVNHCLIQFFTFILPSAKHIMPPTMYDTQNCRLRFKIRNLYAKGIAHVWLLKILVFLHHYYEFSGYKFKVLWLSNIVLCCKP